MRRAPVLHFLYCVCFVPAVCAFFRTYNVRLSGLSASRAELEWKIVYVGSAEDEKHDQTLDSVLVGPVQLGCNKFVFQVKFMFHFNFFLRLFVLAPLSFISYPNSFHCTYSGFV
jgi:hypothetical protein